MSEELIVRHCSPTLAGLKTGSLFTCPCPCKKNLLSDVCKINRCLVSKGLRVLPLQYLKRRALIYIYRPPRLKQDFATPQAQALLKRCGYPCSHPERCVTHLISRLRHSPSFPHEIGLFLGYPPEDVQGFIENRASHCKYSGCWKVYGDDKRARNLFEQYRKCTRSYYRQWEKGKSVTELAVPG